MLTILDTAKNKKQIENSNEYKIIQETNTKSVYKIIQMFSNRIIKKQNTRPAVAGGKQNESTSTE